MLKNFATYLAVAAWFGAVAAAATDEVIAQKPKIAFTPPGGDWRVNTTLKYPVIAGLDSKKLNATITVTYSDYELYDIKVDYGYLEDILKKNEKNTFKPTKSNYNRVSLGGKGFPFGRAARLEFTTFDELGYHHTVVYALNNGTIVYLFSAECLEREWPAVAADLDAMLNTIRFVP